MDWAQTSLIVGICATILTGIGVLIKKVVPAVRKVSRFIDRVSGVPADPESGQQEIVGLFARMDHQDAVAAEQDRKLEEQSQTLETIKHELFPNSGLSLRDQTNRLEAQGKQVVKKIDDHIAACPTSPTTTINVNGGTP